MTNEKQQFCSDALFYNQLQKIWIFARKHSKLPGNTQVFSQ